MQQVTIQAEYQIVKLTLPSTAGHSSTTTMDMVSAFHAPPGFRLHSFQPLKDAALIGQSAQFLLVMEKLEQFVVDVPEPEGGVMPELNGVEQGHA